VQTGSQRSSSGGVTPSKLRRNAIIAVDGVLAVGTGALGGLFAVGTASAAAPTPGWTPTQSPVPAGPDAPSPTQPDTSFNSNSCVSAVFCAAVGYYEDSGGGGHERGLLDVLSGGTWTATEAPLPSDASPTDPDAELDSVSCAQNGSCVAVGEYKDTSNDFHALIETYTGGQWSDMEAPLPANAAPVSGDFGAWLKGVSCPAPGDCVATGFYQLANGDEVGLIDTLSAGQWTAQAAPQPADAAADQAVSVLDVSCPTASFCGAVGYEEVGSPERPVPDTLLFANGTWTASDAPLPSDAATGSGDDSLLFSVSCANTACEGAGFYDSSTSGHDVGLLVAFSPSSSSGLAAPVPPDGATGSNQESELDDVSCTFDGVCAAVGGYDDTVGDSRALVETITNGVPVAQEGPQPGDADATSDAYLDGVSCLSGSTCTAVGGYRNNQNGDAGMMDQLSGSSWSTVNAPLPTNTATGSSEDAELDVVSCTSRGACDAAGDYSVTGSGYQGLLESYTPPEGYLSVASDGGVFNYGSALFHGSMGGMHLNAPMVGMAETPGPGGYWEVASDGGIFSFGNAVFHGSTGSLHLNAPIVGMAATPDGGGYWLVASDGGIFNYGDAGFYGSAGSIHLNKPVVGMAATPDGHGYWLVASDGGIFRYGDAGFYGSRGGQPLNKPIVGMAADATGLGYWLVASDGGIFNYGDAPFLGSRGGQPLNKPIVAMMSTFDGAGYWLTASDGGIFGYGDTGFYGSAGSIHLNAPVVSGTPS
jgi:hypothetical protein